jgi:hypothetical protein
MRINEIGKNNNLAKPSIPDNGLVTNKKNTPK